MYIVYTIYCRCCILYNTVICLRAPEWTACILLFRPHAIKYQQELPTQLISLLNFNIKSET